MKWTGLNELREQYLSFFESKDHLRLGSFPLVPNNDPSLLLINSGMAPMKKFFTGEVEPPRRRVTTCQKCIRTPDLERVGHTARHGTFFEMLGNFSFGDYFKDEAIAWAWEFLTETLQIPKDLLWPSIYESDEEAYHIWKDVIGVPEEHIVRLGKADNFWEHGTGPCGPCSEIYFDRGEKYGCGKADCKPGCDCDRDMEIWNNVFSQFNNMGDGTYEELEQKNIDTGMGLERLACVMQGVDNMFEVDTIRRVIDKVCAISGKQYGDNADNDISIRVITDHTRSAMFMISDSVIPSNEGRGYVLRRIIRRACRHGKLLGIDHPFLTDMVNVAIEESCGAYPELSEKADYIRKVLSMEEERFDATIDAGLSILGGMIEKAKADGASVIHGSDVFKLYDTFGFPIDLTKEIAEENGLQIDEATFTSLMQEQKQRARAARAGINGWASGEGEAIEDLPQTVFTGYDADESRAKVLRILTEDGTAEAISEGDCTIVLDKTPFYGEGGGQIGDTGVIKTETALLRVTDTKKTEGIYLHLCTVESGVLHLGESVTASIDAERRNAIRRNHTCAHLLQAALRKVLGTHVEQAGSFVSESICRFDFTHFAALTKEELAAVEASVNEEILRGTAVDTIVTDVETAKKNGAMALFGEKYGASVRMVKMGEFSTELCGGTHLSSTAKAGLFRILSESSVAAGVRRIEAATGMNVLALMEEKDALLASAAHELKANGAKDVAKRALALSEELKEARREIEKLNAKLAQAQSSDLLKNAVSVGGLRVVAAKTEGLAVDAVRSLTDDLKSQNEDLVIVLSAAVDGKLNFVCACGKKAVAAKAHAGNLVREVAKLCGGGGGGRGDSATAGAKDASKVDEALEAVVSLLEQQIG